MNVVLSWKINFELLKQHISPLRVDIENDQKIQCVCMQLKNSCMWHFLIVYKTCNCIRQVAKKKFLLINRYIIALLLKLHKMIMLTMYWITYL